MENLPAGELAGELIAVDPDKQDFHTFKLNDGNGSDHNDLFAESGNRRAYHHRRLGL